MATAKEEEIEEEMDVTEDNEPIYYKPKTLSLVSMIAAWLSWIILVGFIILIAAQAQSLAEMAAGTAFSALVSNPSARNFIYSNLILPLFTGLTFFVLLQAASIGLSVLLEIEFNIRESNT